MDHSFIPPEKKGGEDFGSRDIGGPWRVGLDKQILGGLKEKGE